MLSFVGRKEVKYETITPTGNCIGRRIPIRTGIGAFGEHGLAINRSSYLRLMETNIFSVSGTLCIL